MGDNDKERQEDELEALQSIYPHELMVKGRWPFSGCLKISPSILHENIPVKVTNKIGDKNEEKTLKIKYLPPIELYFQCPADYPSKSQPFFMISCIWLPDCKLTDICRKLDSMWDNYESEILFTWASFLKEDCCAFLQLEELQITVDKEYANNKLRENDTATSSTTRSSRYNEPHMANSIYKEYGAKTLNVKPLNDTARRKENNSRLKYLKKNKLRRKCDNEDIYQYETPKDIKEKEKNAVKQSCTTDCNAPPTSENVEQDTTNSANNISTCSNSSTKQNQIYKIIQMFGKRRKTKSSDEDDSRVVPKRADEFSRIAKTIEEYNDRILEVEFRTENHCCEVCFDEKPGPCCIRLKPCMHVFCKNCVRDYLTLHILNSNMGALRCLQYECDSSFSDCQIRQNIDDEVYKKYRKFSLKFAIESDPNLLYCPREICQSVASISTLSHDMCHCENCGFYFCMYCKKAYHGIEMCDLKSEERNRVIREYQEASAERKLELEKRFTKQQLMKWVENDLSQKWLEECSKPCPNCRAVIQKIDGCNKMMCSNCNTPFCWLCNLCLSRTQPYKHFIDPQSPCYQKLFPPEEMEEEEEFEDEEEEDEEFFALVDEMLLNVNDPVFEDIWPYYFVE